MKKILHAGSIPMAMPGLVLFLGLILFSACSTRLALTGSTLTTKKDAGTQSASFDEQITRDIRRSEISVQETNRGFSCDNQHEISSQECEVLVVLYLSTDGQHWIDHTGWLTSNTPCSWSGISCIGGHVSHISLPFNQLTGHLPPELGELTHLRALEIWGNQLHGYTPDELGKLAELVILEMSSNQLTGSVPAELGKLSNLKTLSLAHNQLSGSIPPELGKMRNLQSLILSHNHLSGAITNTLGGSGNLYELDLSYNQLSGSVPESVDRIPDRSLWGNQLADTITTDGEEPFSIDYMGVHFASHQSLAESIWPEVIPAITPLEGEPFWYAAPQHLRFTFANSRVSQGRLPMGINLEAEAQILVYPLKEMVSLNPLAEEQVGNLQKMVRDSLPSSENELPLLPLNNALQVFHSQVEYLESSYLQGFRYITQFTQEVRPVINNRELIYTFQGITKDRLYYIAAFFPLAAPVLPEKFVLEDWITLDYDFETYLAETTSNLGRLSPDDFFPQLSLLDAVVISIEPDSNGG